MNNDYLEMIQGLLKDEYPMYLEELKKEPIRSFRINPLKIDDETFFNETNWIKDKVPWSKHSYYFKEDLTVGYTKEFLSGLIYMQEPSASFPVTVLDPKPGERVLDLCAAPGSKSTQIAECMNHEGLLVANEIDRHRAAILKENIMKCGATNTIVLSSSPKDLEYTFHEYFDAILVDAPCSGEGMFRKEEKAIEDWSMEHVQSCAIRQSLILDSAYKLLMPGGRLVYSTCTFNIEENEKTIDLFLMKYPDMHILPIDKEVGHHGIRFIHSTDYARRIYPMDKGEGQFTCLLIKDGEKHSINETYLKSDPITQSLLNKIESLIIKPFPYYYFYQDKLYGGTYPFINVKPCHLVRHQCYIGEVKKGRFEYAHDFFMNAYTGFLNIISLNNDEIHSFLRGEAIKYNIEKGIYPVGFNHHIIGYCKSDGTYLKNKFPKGLRIK